MARLRWTESAIAWLEDIHAYIAADNPAAAASVIDQIVAKCETAASFPAIGSYLREAEEGEVRMVLFGHYRIVYLSRVVEDVVEVLGVFHGALEIERYLK